MSYSVKEIYFTLQGEGAHTGRPAVFLRFAGCNLWSGRERDRAGAACRFCDTDFVGTDGPDGGRFHGPEALATAVSGAWPAGVAGADPYVVCTGGEPLLQLDEALLSALSAAGFETGVETNGTIPAPRGIDWLCVSPKGAAPVVQDSGNELKLVYPQPEPEAQPDRFVEMNFDRFSLQPLDNPSLAENTRAAIRYCLSNPRWQLSLQTHKLIGLP
jgi:7-carboxy-7-deazaguanine synthase (Cx14CxxC type)